MSVISRARQILNTLETRQVASLIDKVRGLTVWAQNLPIPVGGLVRIESCMAGNQTTFGEVVGCDEHGTIIMLFSETRGLAPGDKVTGLQAAQTVPVSNQILGRVINGLGKPIDGLPPLTEPINCPLCPIPISALQRESISLPMPTGICAFDTMITAGRGQRLGIFAGPGVGKSTLLGSVARNCAADISVIALIGERGREVRDFIENAMGTEGLKRSVVVVATSDESPLLRVRASLVAMAVAEYFRDQGHHVMFMMDSLTRYCQAQRQIGLAIGEPPATKGYTPSVFSGIATLLERAGNLTNSGSITGFYAVLVEGDDLTEPISDASRAILDGHISLSRKLANRGHYPAVDILESISRVSDEVSPPELIHARKMIRRSMAMYSEIEELLNIGAYVKGSNPLYDIAINYQPKITALFQQAATVATTFEQSINDIVNLAIEIGNALAQVPT